MRLQLGFSPRPTFEVAASKAGDISRSILKSSYKQEKEKVKQIANIPFPAAGTSENKGTTKRTFQS